MCGSRSDLKGSGPRPRSFFSGWKDRTNQCHVLDQQNGTGEVQVQLIFIVGFSDHANLVGGFNPSEIYLSTYSQIGGGENKYLKPRLFQIARGM